MQSEKLSDIALDRVPAPEQISREVEQSRSRSRSHQTRSRSHSRRQSKSVSRSRSHSYRRESRNNRSRSTSVHQEVSDFTSRRGEIGERFSLIVRGFRDRVDRHELEDVFSKYGKVTDVHIPRDYYTHEQRGFAFIEFDDRHAAEDAVSHVDGTNVAGFVVSVNPAKNNRKTPEEMRRQYKPYE